MVQVIREGCCTRDSLLLRVAAIMSLLMFAGLMSGLTLGLMSLGLVDLEVIKESGSPKDRRNAARIIPVVKRQHLLLVTLLIGNALAMEALPLFLDELVTTWMAIGLSVTLLLMFGEILPQAICTQYGLAVGATMAPLVRVLLVVFFPIAWPVSKVLDKILGKKHGSLFRRAELISLVYMHGNDAGKGGELSRHETNLIAGTLELAGKTAADAMTPISSVMSIDGKAIIDDDVMRRIVESEHSRIPVYVGKPTNIVGLILAKNFLNVSVPCHSKIPTINVPVRPIQRVPDDTSLHDVLHGFCQRRSHMAAVVRCKTEKSKHLTGAGAGASPDADAAADDDPPTMATGTDLKSESNSGDTMEDKVESGLSKESQLRESSREWSSAAPVLKQVGRDVWAGEEGEEIVGIITREDVLGELLKESLTLAKSETIVTIVESQEFSRVSYMQSPNMTSLAMLLRHRPQIRNLDDADALSASSTLRRASAESFPPVEETPSDSSTSFWGSPNRLQVSLKFCQQMP